MPRLVDWGARYDFIREAIVRLAAHGGAGAVTLPAVAAELRVSPATLRRALDSPDVLPVMGARWIARRRQQRRYLRGLPPGVERGSVQHGVWLLRSELPEREEELDQERAWTQLVHGGADESILELQREEDAFVDALVTRVLELLGTEESTREADAIRLRALLDGLSAARCHRRITPEVAAECLDVYLAALTAGALSPDAA